MISLHNPVNVIAFIRKNDTGEVVECPCVNYRHVGDRYPGTYIWEEGNYSCDCNRHIFFEDAHGRDVVRAHECTMGRYSVNVALASTGEVFYREFDLPVQP